MTGPILHSIATFRSSTARAAGAPDLMFWVTDPHGDEPGFWLDPVLLKPESRGLGSPSIRRSDCPTADHAARRPSCDRRRSVGRGLRLRPRSGEPTGDPTARRRRPADPAGHAGGDAATDRRERLFHPARRRDVRHGTVARRGGRRRRPRTCPRHRRVDRHRRLDHPGSAVGVPPHRHAHGRRAPDREAGGSPSPNPHIRSHPTTPRPEPRRLRPLRPRRGPVRRSWATHRRRPCRRSRRPR